ncbi:MAG: response regulator transcription factor [Saprospiraceae bacterium]|nr:response regulator transcription factor [Saprospiraceae bacterium]MBK8448895.1 response regulator transcription factor [Saprospiraceae bacterium]MBK8485839.1 response regulator transcription factor [Saprospiraceae bacterium]MBK9222319.1 response regulator transcription factor [Saprospiraceae bacterium]MBK9722998.1 response regulator transcription factor [Saprospiraceae bacterium]
MKIAILEDLKEVSSMLHELFNEQVDMSCNQCYYNAEDAMKFLPQNPVDILIVDIGLPRASGIDAIKYLTQYCPAMQFCMFTVYEDDEKIFNSLQAGAKGYILKGSATNKIIEAVQELYKGGSPMSPSIARRILDVFQKFNIPTVNKELPITSREKELLEFLAQGFLYKEIADKMGITTGTVKQHIHKIYEKLQVSNRTEAINLLKGN